MMNKRFTIRPHIFKGFVIALLALVISPANDVQAQCLTNVSFLNWKFTGDSGSGTCTGTMWTLDSNNTMVYSSCNSSYPHLFVGPDTFINVRITGSFRVEDYLDDDYAGFVFGFQETWDYSWFAINSAMDHEYYLFDWKKGWQNWGGYTAQPGRTLNKAHGTFYKNLASVFPRFWQHTSGTNFTVLQTDLGNGKGWIPWTQYDFELLYTPTRAVILIDSDTVFDQTGCFEPGLFGFYVFSQTNLRYWNFNYELFVDFQMEAENVCIGDTSRFFILDTGACNSSNAFSNIDTFYWDMGDGTILTDTNPVHLYAAPGPYDVHLIAIDQAGCIDTATKTIYIHEPPISKIGFENVCAGAPMSFSDSTTLPYGFITAWEWDFGDNSGSSSSQSPNYVYSLPGTYNVSLKVTDNAGCVDSTDTAVTVYPNPVADFKFFNACDEDTVRFIQQSTEALAPITRYAWDINNNGAVNYLGDTVEHVYPSFGNYSVELSIKDSIGCRDSIIKTVYVHPIPVADFYAKPVCLHEPTLFKDSSTVALGNVTQWEWNFGDGSFSTQENPVHTFSTSGSHKVYLQITTDSGCVDTVSHSVIVYHLPIADFHADPQCENLPAYFDNNSTSASGPLIAYNWSFGDNNTSNTHSPQHDYGQPGLYQVKLDVESVYGCKDDTTKSIRIYPAPVAGFSWPINVCEGEPLPFTDKSYIKNVTPGGDKIVSWKWTFDETYTDTARNPVYNKTDAHVFRVDLLVESNYGCVDSTHNFPQINARPDAKLTYDLGCEDRVSSFRDASTIRTGLVSEWSWDFGDGGTSDEERPQHTYTSPGEYEVKLYVKSNKGCADSTKTTVYIPETPRVDFVPVPKEGCSPVQVAFKNRSEITKGSLRYRWYLDGEYVSADSLLLLKLQNDTLTPRSFTVALEARSDEGCKATLVRENAVTIFPTPVAAFSIENNSIDMLEPVVEFVNESRNSTSWIWRFGDGTKASQFAPIHKYQNSGQYLVSLKTRNKYGCVDSVERWIVVDPFTSLYIPNSFTPNGDGINDLWFVRGFNEGKEFRVRIWDRWGQMIMESTDMNFTWDGTLPGTNQPAPVGAYVYDIYYYTSDGELREVSGAFRLIR